MEILGDYFTTKEFEIGDILEKDFILNLEFPITNSNNQQIDKICLKSKDSKFSCFKNLPRAVTLANNHIFDFGIKGVQDTLNYLDEKRISYFGIGDDDNNFNQPFNFKKFHFYNYCSLDTNPVTEGGNIKISLVDEVRMIKDITKSVSNGFKPIMIIHWGEEESVYPNPSDVQLARKLISYGAHLIIGHHAHVVQSKEQFGERMIYYGLGNFLFEDIKTNILDHSGNSRSYVKKQRSKNRKSIGIRIQNDHVSVKGYYFNKSKIVRIKPSLPTTILSKRIFTRYLKFMNRKLKILNFLKNPRNISLEKIKRF